MGGFKRSDLVTEEEEVKKQRERERDGDGKLVKKGGDLAAAWLIISSVDHPQRLCKQSKAKGTDHFQTELRGSRREDVAINKMNQLWSLPNRMRINKMRSLR